MSKLKRALRPLGYLIKGIGYAIAIGILAIRLSDISIVGVLKFTAIALGITFVFTFIYSAFAAIGDTLEYNRHRKAQLIAHYLRNQR